VADSGSVQEQDKGIAERDAPSIASTKHGVSMTLSVLRAVGDSTNEYLYALRISECSIVSSL